MLTRYSSVAAKTGLCIALVTAFVGCATSQPRKLVRFSGRVVEVKWKGYSTDFSSGRTEVFDTVKVVLDEPAAAQDLAMNIVLNMPGKSWRLRVVGSSVQFALPEQGAREYFDLVRKRPSLAFVYESELKDALVTMGQYVHTYWKMHPLSKEAPLSENGRYRLVKVNDDGSVELAYNSSSGESQTLVATSKPATVTPGDPRPNVYVAESNPRTQTAVLGELLVK